MLINRDPSNAHTVPVQITGRNLGAKVSQFTYGRTQYDRSFDGDWDAPPATSLSGPWLGTYSATLPAFSVSVLLF